MIVANHICKSMKEKEILKDVSFVIRQGEIVGFIGASGSGKSTLLKLVAGVLEVDEGYIRVDGMDPVRFMYSNKNQIGMIFRNLYNVTNDDISIKDNLKAAKILFEAKEYKSANNRAYYAVF